MPSEKKVDPLPSVFPKNTGDTGTLNFDAIAPKQFTPTDGKDTYQGIPGDGIVPA